MNKKSQRTPLCTKNMKVKNYKDKQVIKKA